MKLTANDIAQPAWDKDPSGLLPAIVQDSANNAVLMLGYMNREALRETFARGRVVFYSRSRATLWEKGETSGNHLQCEEVELDCDADTLLVRARPEGPVCHTGTATCFGDELPRNASGLEFLGQLQGIIAQRAGDPPEKSYTARLFAEGPRRIAQKVGEEGVELALAGVSQDDGELVGEAADLIFHMLVLLRSRGLALEQVVSELQQRHTKG
ncbi:MAG: bifunctional phosphoribosyl-AMP cyclohydrolase/phosphoribosyl-ATP diphosphatase HisIE [Steroidobacteraceae bacterium]